MHLDENGNYTPITNCGIGVSGRTVICINDDQLIKQILLDTETFKKPKIMNTALKVLLGGGLVLAEGELWRRERHLLTPLFHFNHLKNQVPTIAKHAQQGIVDLNQLNGKSVDPYEIFAKIALSVIIDAAFGGDFDVPWMGHQWHAALQNVRIDFALRRLFGDFADYISPLPRTMKLIRSKIQQTINERREKIQNGDPETLNRIDLMSLMIKTKDETTGLGIQDDLIISEALTFLSAGHETTSTAMSWICYFLAKYKDVQQKLRNEVTSILHGNAVENIEQVLQLNYTKFVILESLRLRPPVPTIPRTASTEVNFLGFKIPANTGLNVRFIAAHYNPAYWSNPESFIPERFNNEDNEKRIFAYLPFSAGPRNCIGQKLAMQEITIILSMIIQNFEIEFEDPNRKVSLATRLTMIPVNLFVKFVPIKN